MAKADVSTPDAAAFTKAAVVFDCLGLFYVLDEPYATRCLEAGVNICNVTFALESTWDQTMSARGRGFWQDRGQPRARARPQSGGDRLRRWQPAGSRWSPARKAPA